MKIHNYVVLVDGSGGMNALPGPNAMTITMSALAALDFTARLTGAFNLISGGFGPKTGALWHAPYNLQDPKTQRRLGAQILGADLCAAIRQVEHMAQDAPLHLIIAADGNDCYDSKNQAMLESFLKSSPDATLDATLIGRPNSAFENMLQMLKKSYPRQVGLIESHHLSDVSDNIFANILRQRLKGGKKLSP